MFDAAMFRHVLGHFATGVTVVTAESSRGPVGMAIGSFTSVSLDPPLVGFLPGKTSNSWPGIEAAGRFCVNILGADQLDDCKVFASKVDDKFESIDWHRSALGSPVLDRAIGWIDCEIDRVVDAGDHWFVIGSVHDLSVGREADPMVFFRGGYGTFGR